MLTYWGLMEKMRNKGWQIDRSKLADADKDKAVRIIPSPARKADPKAGCIPRWSVSRRASAPSIRSVS